MNYIKEAIRTESRPLPTGMCMSRLDKQSRAVHAFLGLLTETGEIADGFKRHLFYGQKLDTTNIVEEVGDLMWYIAVLLDHCGVKNIEDCMEANIRKLQKRYPEKYTNKDAAEENRDREAEKVAILSEYAQKAAKENSDREAEREALIPDSFCGTLKAAEEEGRNVELVCELLTKIGPIDPDCARGRRLRLLFEKIFTEESRYQKEERAAVERARWMCEAVKLDEFETDVAEDVVECVGTDEPGGISLTKTAEETRDRKAEQEVVGISLTKTGAPITHKDITESISIDKEHQEQETKARRISQQGKYLCYHCRAIVNDEVVRKLHSPRYHQQAFHCPECMEALTSDRLVREGGG